MHLIKWISFQNGPIASKKGLKKRSAVLPSSSEIVLDYVIII